MFVFFPIFDKRLSGFFTMYLCKLVQKIEEEQVEKKQRQKGRGPGGGGGGGRTERRNPVHFCLIGVLLSKEKRKLKRYVSLQPSTEMIFSS